ncbi:alanine racemase [Auraticoccus monumenti]|uniref:alanine racemase n=1 Tax=Auraticoccus monumenti TaxID=675864 RepID=UPI001E4D012F|nr:alanine racemase [Auraticoccus monumenti]
MNVLPDGGAVPTTDPDVVAAGTHPATASAEVDLDAYAANLRVLAAHVAPAALMAVVKADAYGHGLVACARAARAAGVEWLGVATPGEALALRESGDEGRLLCWLYGPDEDLSPLVAADVDVSAASVEQVSDLVGAAATTERVARVHLKIDTGLHRNGSPVEDWPAVVGAAAEGERFGAVEVVGVWSHLATAEDPDHPSVAAQLAAFGDALEVARTEGLDPRTNHLANSAGALLLPAARHQLVRAGIATYGIDPAPGVAASVGVALRPVMTLRAQLVAVKAVAAGEGVSYGHTWIAPADTVVGLVPLGYGDGVPRHASSVAEAWAGGRRVPVRGRVCMDQLLVELGPDAGEQVGEEVVLFGAAPAPTAEDWAEVCGTIGYEIVTRIGPRVPRRHHGGARVDVGAPA